MLSADDINDFTSKSDSAGISKLKKIVVGGPSRAESVRNGFDVVGVESEIVAVHDGARPMVSPDEITRTIEMAANVGAACLVAPVTDTIKTIRDDRITGTVDRSLLRRALTPQAFRYDILREALLNKDLDESVTDECSLVEKRGVEIAFVEGSARNIKITHPDDLMMAELFLRDYE